MDSHCSTVNVSVKIETQVNADDEMQCRERCDGGGPSVPYEIVPNESIILGHDMMMISCARSCSHGSLGQRVKRNLGPPIPSTRSDWRSVNRCYCAIVLYSVEINRVCGCGLCCCRACHGAHTEHRLAPDLLRCERRQPGLVICTSPAAQPPLWPCKLVQLTRNDMSIEPPPLIL